MARSQLVSLCRAGAALAVLAGVWPAFAQSPDDPFGVFASRQSGMSRALSDGSSAFVANKGQWDSEALFLSRTNGVDSWVVPTGVVFDFHRYVEDPEPERPADLREEFERGPRPLGVSQEDWDGRRTDPREERQERMERTRRVGHVVRMAFLGTAPMQQPKGEGLQQGRFNYYIGNDESKWATDVPRYAKAVVRSLYPGIDAVYYVDEGSPRYDLFVHPGADPSRTRFALVGAESVRVTREGRLAFGTRFGEFEMTDVRAFQGSRAVSCALSIVDGVARFELGPYDRSKPLTIDPLLSSTFLGGSGDDYAVGVAVEGAGNAAVSGETCSTDFPTAEGAYDRTYNGGYSDAFLVRLDPRGGLLSSTFLGGSDYDNAYGVAVDSAGNAAAWGTTFSTDFTTTEGAYDRTPSGGGDAFVVRLSPAGGLLSSTLLGGSDHDYAEDLAVDGSGNAAVCGYTSSADFPTSEGAHDRTFNGSRDAFVARLSPSGGLLSSTFLGGEGDDLAQGVAVDGSGNAAVCGRAGSTGFPTTEGANDRTYDGGWNAFVARLDSAGGLLSSTFLGGGDSWAFGVAVDGSGNAAVCGYTSSKGFPTTEGAWDQTYNGGGDAFVARLSPAGGLLSSTYLGGAVREWAAYAAVDSSGNAAVCGYTSSTDFPTTEGAYAQTHNGSIDAFVARLSPSGGLLSSTFLGGASDDWAFGVAVDGSGNAAVCGRTGSTGFPTTDGAHDRTHNGGFDAFVARLNVEAPLSGRIALSDFGGAASALTATFTLRVAGMAVETVSGVALGADGSFSFTTNALGTIEVSAKVSHWLSKTMTLFWDDGGLTGLVFDLANGDVDGDNAVTVFDYNLLSEAFDSVEGDSNWNPNADLDGDGAVTVFDYNILSENFDRVGE